MKNFIFKSSDADLQKIITIILSDLNILKKNSVYSTYRLDSILKLLQSNSVDQSLQRQVDDYFDPSDVPPPQDKVDLD